MSKRVVLFAGFLVLFSLLAASCGIPNPRFSLSSTDKWSTGQKSEEEFKKYFDTNANNLHPIEGIWNISSSNKIVYRIAIVRYQPDTAYDYDYVGVLLMSSAGKEEPGLVKVEFRTLSQGGIMKAIWHYQDDTVGIKEFIQLNKDVIKDTGSDLVLSKTYPKTK